MRGYKDNHKGIEDKNPTMPVKDVYAAGFERKESKALLRFSILK